MGIFKFFKKNKEELKEEILEEIQETKEDFEDLKDDVKEELQELKEDISEKISDIKEEMTEKIADIKEKAEEKKDKLDETENNITEESKKGFFTKIIEGIDKTRKNIMSSVDNVLKSFVSIDEELFEELEEALIMSDIGVDTSVKIISLVKERVKKEKVTEVSDIKQLIIDEITQILTESNQKLILPSPSVILVIGVNGVGKTTTIGKLIGIYKKQGKSVIVAAADTFRAAAIDQLEVWGKRSNVDVIKHKEGSDPAAVVFDAVQASKARNADLLIVDTAGRLHNKKNLMDELSKISRVISREFDNAHKEIFLVLDATTGQNAMQQAKLFKEAADITGIILTKLDGTAKGGIVIAIKNELNIPVRFIGVGEGIDDLQTFNAEDFAKALFTEK